MNRKLKLTVTGLMIVLLAASTALAAGVKTGEAGPDFSAVPGTDGKKHSLSDYQKAKVVVVAFTCNHCPVAKAYEDRLIALQKDYRDKGVQVVAICVNDLDADRLEKMKDRAKEKGFNFPYVYDASQKSARQYGATVTPHVFVLDPDRKVAYQGAIDDNNNPEKVKKHYLRDAVDALLAGKKPPETSANARGCGIKWSAK